MYMICRHIKTNGLRCESPALKDAQFCYYHSKVHTVGAEPHLKYGPSQLPAPEDSAAIQLSVARINDAIINDRIDSQESHRHSLWATDCRAVHRSQEALS